MANLAFFLIVTYVLTVLQATTYKREELMQFIVHDLRSPLSVIILGLSILQRASDDMNETQQGLVKSTLASSRWMSTLINSILDLSRLESRQIPLQIEEIKVRELVELSVEQVTLWAERSQISLTIELNTDKETVHADRELTMRILVNLLSNAIKLSPPQSVVTVRVTPATANMLAFSVADQGPGIPPKWIERVFDKFTQIEARRVGVSVGSGLGLTFCRLAVEAQGGQISLTSEVGQGTTVTFTLPIMVQP